MDIQALLGHESIAITQIYTHAGQGAVEQVGGGYLKLTVTPPTRETRAARQREQAGG